jgi:two-component system response regulator VicR
MLKVTFSTVGKRCNRHNGYYKQIEDWSNKVAKIFIVEDDQDLNSAYRLILSKEGHTVDSAFNGDEALEKVSDFNPDLILLDLLMPVKSGVEFLQEYDVVNKHPDVKVLIFTNLEHASEIHEAFRLGANQCIIKAWTAPQGLVKIVNDVLGNEDTGDGKRDSRFRRSRNPSFKAAM